MARRPFLSSDTSYLAKLAGLAPSFNGSKEKSPMIRTSQHFESCKTVWRAIPGLRSPVFKALTAGMEMISNKLVLETLNTGVNTRGDC